jgi:outer membrane protein TolC
VPHRRRRRSCRAGAGGLRRYIGIKSDKQIAPASQFESAQSLPAQGGQWPTLDWASQFGDPQLPKLIDEALQGNPSIAQAQARIAKASSYIESSRSNLMPKAEASYVDARALFFQCAVPAPYGGQWYSENNVLASASWDLDLWGKNRERLHTAVSQEKAAEADMQQAHHARVVGRAHL